MTYSYSHLNESAGHPSSSNASLRKAISFALQSDKNVKMLAASTFLYIQKFMSHLETLFLVSPWYLGHIHSIIQLRQTLSLLVDQGRDTIKHFLLLNR